MRNGAGPPDRTWLGVLAQPFVRSAPGTLSELRYDTRTETLTASVQDPGPDRTVLVSWPASVGTPRSVSSCAVIAEPYRPATGELELQLSTPNCQIDLRG